MSNAHRLALPAGSQIQQYQIEDVLGYGGFGIVYKAKHMHLGQEFAIKEFLPQEIATREGNTVHPLSTKEHADYEEGMRRFLAEAKQLVQFRQHPNIVSCTDFFEANGTAYLVMNFEDGMPLSDLLVMRQKRDIALTENQFLNIVLPLLDGLRTIHENGVLHRDIKPGNIFIRRSDEQPVLLDFGAAKQNFSKHSKSMAPITPGYAAFEQSGEEGDLGPWTDIYAIGAVMWRMLANDNPPKVENRVRARIRGGDDPLTPATEIGRGQFSDALLRAIDKCLNVGESERFQSVRELENALSVGTQQQYDFSGLDELIDIAGSDRVITESEVSNLLKKAERLKLPANQALNYILNYAQQRNWRVDKHSDAKQQRPAAKAQPQRDRPGPRAKEKQFGVHGLEVTNVLAKPGQPSRYVRVVHLARHMQVPATKLVSMILAGFYRGKKINGTWHIAEDDVDKDTSAYVRHGFWGRLVRGHLGLPLTFWVFGVIMGWLWSFVLGMAIGIADASNSPAPVLIVFPLYLAYVAAVLTGQWNAAGIYQGPKFWAVLVRILVVVNILILVFSLISILANL
jgi:serine/threonine protein kinase